MGDATWRDVVEGRARWCVIEADALAVLAELPDGCVDLTFADVPYSSGGLMRSDRNRSTDEKYTGTEYQGKRPDFSGDCRDGRSWAYWCSLWMGEALRASTPDSRMVCWADWRQLPSCTDAIQCGGWIWRGIVPWDKGEGSRPTPGGFRAQCEYLVWGSRGPLPASVVGVTILPGYLSATVRQDDKFHQTGKPTSVCREVVKIAPRGGLVVSPFAGSGTEGVAALLEGRRVILVERVHEYAEIARARCAAAETGADWRRPEQGTLALPGVPR